MPNPSPGAICTSNSGRTDANADARTVGGGLICPEPDRLSPSVEFRRKTGFAALCAAHMNWIA